MASLGDFPYDEGKHLTMVLEMFAYADESGTQPEDAYCMLGGFVASPRQWKLFRKAWRSVLDREGVPVFHAVDFFQRASWVSRDSPYHGWKPQRAERFLTALLLTLRERPQIKDIGGLVNNADFFALTDEERRLATGAKAKIRWDFPGGEDMDFLAMTEAVTVEDPAVLGGAQKRPYPAAFFLLVKDALPHVPDGAKIHFVLDLHSLEEGLARVNYAKMIKEKMHGWEKLGGISYEQSALHEPLQAADLYAYIVTHWVAKEGDVSPSRRQAADILIGKRRRKLPVRDAASFKEDRTRMLGYTASHILAEVEKGRRGISLEDAGARDPG